MAVVFGTSANGGGYPQISTSVSHTLGITSGNNRVVLAFVEAIGPSPHSFTTANYNGVAMVQLDQRTASIFGRITSMTVFYMLDATLPAGTGSYNFTYQIAAGAYDSKAGVLSYQGAVQSAPGFTGSSNSNNPALSGIYTTNITTVGAAGIIVDGWGGEPSSGAGSGTPGASQVERIDVSDTDEYFFVSGKPYTGVGSKSMSWTPSGSYYTASHVLVELREVATTPNVSSMMFGMNL